MYLCEESLGERNYKGCEKGTIAAQGVRDLVTIRIQQESKLFPPGDPTAIE